MSVFVRPKMAPALVPAMKAGPVGSGAGVLMTEFPLSSILGGNDPRKKMRKAYQLGIEVPWIRAAEKVICGSFSSVPWHLEDKDDVEIDDEYAGEYAQQARTLIAKPNATLPVGQRLTRSYLWWLTCRHVGLCGNAFWFLDGINPYGIPNATLYIRPDRMWPDEDSAGNLKGWWIDRTANDPGIHVELEQVLHFMLEPPDQGHFGIGLVESAIMKAQLSLGLDRHLAQVLGAGGRLAGILAPKAGDHLEEPQYQQLVADARTIVEQPDAAKRLQVLRGPVEFTPTAMNSLEMALREFMVGSRDDLLGLWGVPVSMLGIHDRGRGLGQSTIIEHDDATLWKMAVHPRLGNSDEGGFVEVVQGQLLDRWTEIGVAVELEIEEPSFEEDGPKFDNAQKAISIPLRTAERREILGLEPFGPDVRNPETGILLDDEIWMPATMVQAFAAPSDGTPLPQPEPEPEPQPVPAALEEAARAAGETSEMMPMTPMKAGIAESFGTLKRTTTERLNPRIAGSVAAVLASQKRQIIERVRANLEAIVRKPKDADAYLPAKAFDQQMREALGPHLASIASTVAQHVAEFRPAKADWSADEYVNLVTTRVLNKGAARVTGITGTTRDTVVSIIKQTVKDGIEKGMGMAELGDALEESLSDAPAFDEYRAEMIARTETGTAWNEAAMGSYREAGIEMVEVLDGDGDDICAEAVRGSPYPIDSAPEPLGHPNCTRDILPYFGGA